jgi:hypothetical protein
MHSPQWLACLGCRWMGLEILRGVLPAARWQWTHSPTSPSHPQSLATQCQLQLQLVDQA